MPSPPAEDILATVLLRNVNLLLERCAMQRRYLKKSVTW